jgi:hypothetical protein
MMTTVAPRRWPDRLERRLAEGDRLCGGFGWLVATGLGYAVCIVVLALGGDQPGDLPPWLRIPEAEYFWWEAAFIGPVIVATGLLTAASIHLMARSAGGAGSFDDTLAVLGPAVFACTLFTLVPDLVIGLLLNTGVLSTRTWMEGITHPSLILALVWAYLSLYAVAFLVAFPAVVRVVHRLHGLSAVAIGWTAFAIYQGTLLIFVR